MSETEEPDAPEKMIIVVEFSEGDSHQDTAKEFDEIMQELRTAFAHKKNVQVYGAMHELALHIITELIEENEKPVPR